MDKIEVTGGRCLKGEVAISGAKNAALPILASALLTDGPCCMENVPDLMDVRTTLDLLAHLGAKVFRDGTAVTVDASGVNEPEAPYELVRKMRASVLVLGPLAARLGRAKVSLPGGCAIGARPIDLHLKGLEAMGAKVVLDEGYVTVSAGRLKGAEIYLDIPTVTGTENLMMAAALAKGTTVLRNAAREPEITALADALNAMGAQVSGAGTPVIEIIGREKLHPADSTIIPDRIEAGTFMTAAAITNGDILVKGARSAHMGAVIEKMVEAGVVVDQIPEGLRVRGPETLQSVDVKTAPFPGFATDMQAQFMVMMCLANGRSTITETIFENRFIHVSELTRLGADISIVRNSAVVKGVASLKAAPVMASDLRASACLVLAGLVASGSTLINRVYHIDRGYESIEKKLSGLGAQIRRIQ
ncbi:MAG: UDP-N-acetylglucosamine 1-carboxyvinyltransferase [Desulfatibacillaceae bacterium]|nr:UDP-N-acetylglucosamine 1-carboxyvinyltransferase [Desulfatibacillaceae bacterium]